MRKLGPEYSIYVPRKFVSAEAYAKFMNSVIAASGGATEVAATGRWLSLPVDKPVTEEIVVITSRVTEQDYVQQAKLDKTMYEFALYLLVNGEKEVMRSTRSGVFMQQLGDKHNSHK